MAGETVSQVYDNGKAFNLVVRASEDNRGSIERIRDLMIDDAEGRKVPLSYVADVVSSMGPNTINGENVKRKIVISANTSGRDLRSVVDDIRKRVDDEIRLPEGYHIEYGGQFESEQAASRTLLLASFDEHCGDIPAALCPVQERGAECHYPAQPAAGIDRRRVCAALHHGRAEHPCHHRFISLFGIATRNGMLLISHYNLLREELGMGLRECIVHGSLDRLNPILKTALSSALALIPLALRGRFAGQRNTESDGESHLGRLAHIDLPQCLQRPIVYELMHRSSTTDYTD